MLCFLDSSCSLDSCIAISLFEEAVLSSSLYWLASKVKDLHQSAQLKILGVFQVFPMGALTSVFLLPLEERPFVNPKKSVWVLAASRLFSPEYSRFFQMFPLPFSQSWASCWYLHTVCRDFHLPSAEANMDHLRVMWNTRSICQSVEGSNRQVRSPTVFWITLLVEFT